MREFNYPNRNYTETPNFQREIDIPSVQELKQSSHLADLYSKKFKERYGTEPVFPLDNAHLTTFKDIQKIAGKKAPQLIEHYLGMNDEWFIKQGHSTECLKKSITQVNASYGTKARSTNHGKIVIKTEVTCDKCFKHYQLEIEPKHLFDGTARHCELCSWLFP